MKEEIICNHCNTPLVLIENRMFFSEKKTTVNAFCPMCKTKLLSFETDGWFFVQPMSEYLNDLKDQEQIKDLVYPMP